MRSPVLFLVLLTGCPGSSDDAPADDTGGDGPIVYEEGCITVDGGGGYAHINDAITVAADGAVIELCDGTYEEAVIVDKPVTLRGASADGTVIDGPGSDIPLTVTATGVVLENLVLDSARTGINLKKGSESTLSSVTVASAGSWAVSSVDATAVITGLTIVEPGAGGVQVSGGSVSITAGSLDSPGGYGIEITDDAVVSITDTTITGTVMLSDNVSDGFAVLIDGGTLSMTNSTIAGAEGMGIRATDADITLVDSTIENVGFIGIFAVDTTMSLSGLSLTGALLQGIYAVGPTFSMVDSTIAVDPTLSCDLIYDEWNTEGNPWCGGLLIAADTIDLSAVDISGYNNYGLLTQPLDADVAALTITGGTIDNVGRWGAYFASSEGTVAGLTVSNSREPETVDPCAALIVDRSAGILSYSSDLALSGLTVTGNVGWGMSQVLSSGTVTDSLFDGNGCYTFVNYQSVATLTGNTFTNGAPSGGVLDNEGVLTLDGNTFVDNKAGGRTVTEYEDYTYTYEASGGRGVDVMAYMSGALAVTNNTFSGGDTSIIASEAGSVEVTGNTWTDYESTIFQASSLDSALFADNIIDDVAGSIVQAGQAHVDIENIQIGTTRASIPVEISIIYDYTDDKLDSSFTYTSSSSNFIFYTYGSYSEKVEDPGSLIVRDVSVTSAVNTVFYVYNSSLDVTGFEVGTVGSSILSGNWSGIAPDVEINGLTAGAVASSAVSISNQPVSGGYGSVTLSDFHVESAMGNGIYASGIGALALDNVSFGIVSGDAVRTASRAYAYTYDADSGTYLYTDHDAHTALTVNGLAVLSTSGTGIGMMGGSASLANVVLGTAGNVGFDLEGLDTVVVSESTISGSGGAGFESTDRYDYYSYETSSTLESTGLADASLTNTTVTGAGGHAFSFDGGSVTMRGVSGNSTTSSGLALTNVDADVQGNTFTGNAQYGMTCDDSVTLSVCDENDLSGNTLGTHYDCSDTCDN